VAQKRKASSLDMPMSHLATPSAIPLAFANRDRRLGRWLGEQPIPISSV